MIATTPAQRAMARAEIRGRLSTRRDGEAPARLWDEEMSLWACSIARFVVQGWEPDPVSMYGYALAERMYNLARMAHRHA